MYKVCAFTGHRNLKNTDFDGALLARVVRDLAVTGTDTFLCGMAVGFDMEAAECVLELKDKFPVKLVCCLPCLFQYENFGERERERYRKIMNSCDKVFVLAGGYKSGVMHLRDRFLVDNCNVLVSFLRRETGGTHYTVEYARKKNVTVIKL